MTSPITVLLVDDQALFREGLRTLLSVQPDLEVVGEAANGEEAVRLATALRPSVVLMDLQMPVLDGVAATRSLRDLQPECRVIVLTTFDDDEYVFEGLRAGAVGYLLKDAPSENVRQTAHNAMRSFNARLSDAARYTGKSDLAEQSLRALRTRFGRAPEGHAAAFLLGRLRESQGANSDAKTWYDTYLHESPGGAYAAEALAGKMRAVLKTDGSAAAEPLAQEYLKRYPTGVHAGTARGILARQ